MTAVAVAALSGLAGLLWILGAPSRGTRAPVRPGSTRRDPTERGSAPSRSSEAAAPRGWSRRPPSRRSARRTADRVEAEALDLLDGLAPALRAGLPPAAALRLIITSGSGLREERVRGSGAGSRSADVWGGGDVLPGLGEAAAHGDPLAPVWSAHAEAVRSDDLRLVAAAWSMCETWGSPLAATVSTVSDVVRRRRAVRQRITAALAGPRATMRVLTALPLSGPLLALAVGVPPGVLYTEPASALSLGAGLTLLALGRLWAARMIRAVTVEPRGRG